MKVALVVLLAFVAMASAQEVQVAHLPHHNSNGVQVAHLPDQCPNGVQVVDNNNPGQVQVVDNNPGHGSLDNVDPGFYLPHDSPQYQQPNADPAYVVNPDGSLYYPNQQEPYPYRERDPYSRGGK